MEESTGPSEFKNVSMLASVTSWLSGMVAPGRQDRPAATREQLDLLLPDHVVPPHARRRWTEAGCTVLLMLMEMRACPCCTPMLETCPTGTPAMLTVSPLARPVTSVSCASMVWRLLNSEMLPILTASPASRTRQTRAKTHELERRLREVAAAASRQAPEKLGDDAAEGGRRGLVGLPDDAVGLVGRGGGRAVGAGRGGGGRRAASARPPGSSRSGAR